MLRPLFRSALFGGLSLISAAVLADGSGTLGDSSLSLSYTSEPYTMANQVQFTAGQDACEEGTPLCDVYTLTVNLSDGFRTDPANANAYVDVALNSAGDFDMYIYDGSGALVVASEETGAEFVSLSFDQIPNGTYKLELVPYQAIQASAELSVAVSGIEAGKSGLAAVLGGGLPAALLLPLILAVGMRRRSC